jgi:GntR family transcriptional regulator
MYIRVERGVSAPISRQIAEQIRAQCLAGLLKAGQCLPSVRQLARELVVNVNTVVRVYERLAAEGLIEMRHGEGTFVLPPPTSTDGAADLRQHREQFAREFQGVVRRGLLAGLTLPELRAMLTEAVADAREQISREHSSETRDDRTSDRDRPARQELRISEGASEYFAEHSARADVGPAGTQRRGKDNDDPHSAGGATG